MRFFCFFDCLMESELYISLDKIYLLLKKRKAYSYSFYSIPSTFASFSLSELSLYEVASNCNNTPFLPFKNY